MPRPHRHANRSTTCAFAALAALAALLASGSLAACGSSGSPSTSNTTAKEQAAEQKAESKFAKFARCLREHGLNAQPINRPGGAHGLKVNGSGGQAATEAAEKACARFKPKEPNKGKESPQEKVENEESLRKVAKCLREHGVKAQTSPAGGLSIQAKPGSGEVNPESPAFKAAQSACQKLLPGGGPPGG